MRAWAFEHEADAIRDALAEITAGCSDVVVGEADLDLIACWTLNDRELPGGGTLAERYARRPGLSADEADVARRIAATRMGLLRVVGVDPGRSIDLDDMVGGRPTRVMSHGISRAVRTDDVIVARVMDGPPAASLWGPVATLTKASGRELMNLLTARITESSLQDSPIAVAAAMRLEARAITRLLAAGLAGSGTLRTAA